MQLVAARAEGGIELGWFKRVLEQPARHSPLTSPLLISGCGLSRAGDAIYGVHGQVSNKVSVGGGTKGKKAPHWKNKEGLAISFYALCKENL
jgi:hypothetical protein